MQVIGIAIKGGKGAPMQKLTEVEVTKEAGLKGDFRGKGGKERKRQITVLCVHQWQSVCEELGACLPWCTRRANILVDYQKFGQDLVGKEMYFDGGVVLEITGETDPCERMDEAHAGLRKALAPDWRGGVTCRVVQEGVLRLYAQGSFL